MQLSSFRLIAAPFTPMQRDGALNLSVVGDYARRLVDTGLRGVFVGGTSGEGQSLTLAERMALAEAWAGDPLRSKLELFVHVGHNCQADAARLAAHAAEIGADRISLHAPTWFKHQSIADLIEFSAAVANAAPQLPFYLYDIPKITGVQLSAAEFLLKGKQHIPSLAGIKYTNPDCVTVQECVGWNDGACDVLWGCDETLLAGIALGAAGAVGSTYNFAAPLYLRMVRAVESGDWRTARAEQARAVAMVRAFERYSTLAALKFAMSSVGIDCGPVRPPLANLSPGDQRRLRDELESAQYFS